MKFSFATVGKLAAAAALSAVAFGASAQKTQLTVYTALETDQLKAYQAGFEKANPNIEIVWVRDSTGIITAKLLAEKNNPKADVVMGAWLPRAWPSSTPTWFYKLTSTAGRPGRHPLYC